MSQEKEIRPSITSRVLPKSPRPRSSLHKDAFPWNSKQRGETKVETTGETEGPAQSQLTHAPIGVMQSSNPMETSSTVNKHPQDVGTENHSCPRSTFGRGRQKPFIPARKGAVQAKYHRSWTKLQCLVLITSGDVIAVKIPLNQKMRKYRTHSPNLREQPCREVVANGGGPPRGGHPHKRPGNTRLFSLLPIASRGRVSVNESLYLDK